MEVKPADLSHSILKSYLIVLSICLSLLSMNLWARDSESTGLASIIDQNVEKSSLIYLSKKRLDKVKILIENEDPFFTEAYKKLIAQANKELQKSPNPVTNKTQVPPSGDKHDYMSIAPYRWPNPNTADGFPWIVKDGEINPIGT